MKKINARNNLYKRKFIEHSEGFGPEDFKGIALNPFNKLEHLLEMLVNSPEPGLVIMDEPGIGKSFTVMQTLNRMGLNHGIDYIRLFGYSTPLELINSLFEHRSKRCIILDDMDGSITKKIGIQVLKGALDNINGSRVVRYSSPHFPEGEFVLQAKLIFIANDLPDNEDVKAILDRCLYLKFKLTHRERIDRMQYLINNDLIYDGSNLTLEEKNACLKFLASQTTDILKPTIRDLKRLFSVYEHCCQSNNRENFKELALALITHKLTSSESNIGGVI